MFSLFFNYPLFSIPKVSLLCVYLFWLSSAASCRPTPVSIEAMHPLWPYLNQAEAEILDKQGNKGKCLVTKFGEQGSGYVLRFQVAAHQRYLNENTEKYKLDKDVKGIVELHSFCHEQEDNVNVVLTPYSYGFVTETHFPKTLKVGIKHRFMGHDNGLPKEFLEELLALNQEKPFRQEQDTVVILSTGLEGYLGIDKALRETIQGEEKDKKGRMKCYIRTTCEAITLHNQYTQAGKRVFTFIHLCA